MPNTPLVTPPDPVANQPWYLSKTVWGSILVSLGVALQAIPGVPGWIGVILIAVGTPLAGVGIRGSIIKNGTLPPTP